MNNRVAFIDFVQGLLHLDPALRWSPQQARMHPFVLGEPLTQPFSPPPILKSNGIHASSKSVPPSPQLDQKRPYGGLPPAPQRSATRTYENAAFVDSLARIPFSSADYSATTARTINILPCSKDTPLKLSKPLNAPRRSRQIRTKIRRRRRRIKLHPTDRQVEIPCRISSTNNPRSSHLNSRIRSLTVRERRMLE